MKKMLITGAGSGLGAEIAKVYAKKGYHTILIGRREEPLLKTAESIRKGGGEADIALCDISEIEEVNRVIEGLIHIHKEIEGLINNAGVGYFGPIEQVTINEIDRMIDINVKGTIYMTKAILSHFKTIGRGKIINIISTAGLRGKVRESAYVASKFAVRGFTESLVKELEEDNIQVTAVYMGGMDTPFWQFSDHIKDKSRLKAPSVVAKEIMEQDDGRAEIFIDK